MCVCLFWYPSCSKHSGRLFFFLSFMIELVCSKLGSFGLEALCGLDTKLLAGSLAGRLGLSSVQLWTGCSICPCSGRCHRHLLFCQLLDQKSEKAMAPHSSTLAWKIPWTEEPGRLRSMGSLRVGHDWATSLSLFTFMHWRRKWQPTPVFLPGESQGRGSLVGCRLWGRTESDTTEATQQQQQTRNARSVSSFFFLLPFLFLTGICAVTKPWWLHP